MNPTWPLAYAADIVSYILQQLAPRDVATIQLIAVFGSAARGDTTPGSDVDLFIQCPNVSALERKVATILTDFEASTRVRDYWRPLGVRLPIDVKVGRTPSAFAAIPDALAEHGKILYAPYRAPTSRARARQQGVIFAWENIDNPSARANIQRNLFGYESHGKRYPGLVATLGGRRLTKGAIWVPVEHLVTVERLFRKNRVTCRLMRVSDDAPTAERSPAPSPRRTAAQKYLPGEVATKEQMMATAKLFAEEDTADGFSPKYYREAQPSKAGKAPRRRGPR